MPIPTYYGDEICHVNGMQLRLGRHARRARATGSSKWASATASRVALGEEYELKESRTAPTGASSRCSAAGRRAGSSTWAAPSGLLAERLREAGHEVTGVDVVEHAGVRDAHDASSPADLDAGIPAEAATATTSCSPPTCSSTCASPSALLRDAARVLRPGGSLIVCVPNFGHWYPRFRTLLGRFDYDQRGTLDRGHLRFFTRRSIKRLLGARGSSCAGSSRSGCPSTWSASSAGAAGCGRSTRVALAIWPTLFGYQFILEAESR